MKLVKIEDVRVGQIWKDNEGYLIVIGDDLKGTWYNSKGISCMGGMEICDTVHHKLIGFLGITHEIKDNRLVEIPRAELEVDDVVKDNFNHFSHVINREIFDHSINKSWPDEKCFEAINETYGSRDFASFELKKIGILGVTHEFVNERLAR